MGAKRILAEEICEALTEAGVVDTAEIIEDDLVGVETPGGERYFLNIEDV